MEFKILTPKEFTKDFPKVKLSEEFFRITEFTKVVRIKGTKRFRPLYTNYIGVYYLIKGRECYV
jgi:hypothetical protein